MAKRERFDTLCIITNNAALLWKNARGIAPDDVADKMDIAMLDWQSSLTQTLRIWIDKGLSMSNGELILARANLGAVVESWLKFFYCVFYDQYSVNPKTDRSGRSIEPENLKFEDLRQHRIIAVNNRTTTAGNKKYNASESLCFQANTT